MVREFFASRAKAKIFSSHVFRSVVSENFRAKTIGLPFLILCRIFFGSKSG
ncbi:DUF1661 domain-containing protein [Porphyromonas gulae]|uniref:DUF1661 domain-containing protein n=1 Tax=Porphyromonas gulae TaxID=111105 RepID=UPI0026F0EE92|nr:DUF1661 domain-containing protein [Porphyromonas gulae]